MTTYVCRPGERVRVGAWAESIGMYDMWFDSGVESRWVDEVNIVQVHGDANFIDVVEYCGARAVAFSSMEVQR